MIIDAYSNYSLPEENKMMLIEALEYLIEETHDPKHMMHLGGIYYDDSVMTIAVADALIQASADGVINDEAATKNLLIDSMHRWGHKYPRFSFLLSQARCFIVRITAVTTTNGKPRWA